ncbi:MAG: hypothetical protein E4H08_01005, partial [Candidatus Atribacteria bacterium]
MPQFHQYLQAIILSILSYWRYCSEYVTVRASDRSSASWSQSECTNPRRNPLMHPPLDILMSHRTIRSFKADPVDAETLDLILKAGTRAATPAEMQFYSLIVVDDPEMLKKLDVRSPVAIVACVDLHRHNRWMAMRQGAPLQGTTRDLLFCFWDVALTLQNMAIAAESLGLGTLTAIRELYGLFDLPEGVYPAA